MKISFATLFILSLLFIRNGHAQSTPWSSLNAGLYGGNITSVFSFGNFLFAGTYNDGIYVSTDNGSNWKTANVGMPKFSNIVSITTDGTNLYAGSYFSGLYVSSDNGASWKNMPQASVNHQITAMQLVGSSLFCATVNGIWVTTDKGSTSKSVNVGLPVGTGGSGSAWVSCLAVKETNLFAGLFYKGIYRSKDNGATWAALTNGFPADNNVTSILVNGSSVIAGTNTGVYISFDNGDSWLNYTLGLPTNFPAYSLAVYNNKIYAGIAGYGLYYSDNNGSTWQPVNIGINNFESVQSLHINGTTIYAGTSMSGVVASKDGGSTWAATNNGLTNESIYGLVKKNGSIFTVTERCKVYESTDHGTSWVMKNSQFSGNPLTALTVKGDSLLATTNGSGIYFSTNNGATWSSMNYNINSSSAQVFDLMVYKNKIIVGSVTGVYQYNPQTNEWIQLGTGLPANPLVFKLFSKKDILYVGTFTSGLYRSKDDGATWTKVTLAANAITINSIAASGNYVVATANGSMFSSKDDGNTWQTHTANTVGNAIVTSVAVDSSYVFFGSYDGAYFSTNHGLTMTKCNTGLPEIAWVYSLLRDGDKIWAGTSEGIWSIPITAFAPTITSFSPASGTAGTLVTITGTNFDNLPEYNMVKFNGAVAKVISVSSTGLVAEVPAAATKGRITVTVAGRTATTASDFCISPAKPTITAGGLTTVTPTLTSSSSTGNQWFLNNTLIEGAINQTLNISKEGMYTVQVTANGCSSPASDGFSIIITEIENALDQNSFLSIYPVPSRDNVIVNLNRFNPNKDVHIQIVNSLGQEIYTDETNASSNLSVDVSYYINGIYIVKARQGNIFLTGRIIKI